MIDLQLQTEVIELTVNNPSVNLSVSSPVVALAVDTTQVNLEVATSQVELTLGTGPAGVGIESLAIEGVDLIATYTNGDEQNVGRVVGYDGRGITSVTQPSGPSTAQVNYTSGSPDTINLPAGPAGANGDRYATTSTTSFSIPSNNQQRTFTVGTGLAYTNEQTIIVATTDGSGHHWHGVVDSYNAGTGVIVATCTNRTGTGTYASWQVNLSGAVGTAGDNGWSPVLAVVTDGSRRVFQVADWVGGTGTKPATGLYVGATGLVSDIALAVDVRGATGATGATGNGIASITQPNGTATMLVTYTDATTQTVFLPNSMQDPNIAPWGDPFITLDNQSWTGSNSGATNPAIVVPADTNESGGIVFSATNGGVNVSSTIVRNNANISVNGNVVWQCTVRILTLPDATDDYSFVMGLFSGASVNPNTWANQITIRSVRSGGSVFWQATCRATTETSVTGVVALTANTNYCLQFKKTASGVTFWVNGVVLATITTNVPSGNTYQGIYRLWKLNGTNNRTVQQYSHYERFERTNLISYAIV